MHEEISGVRESITRTWGRGVVGVAAVVTAVLACYGTLALAALLPLLGASLALNDAVWSSVILLFAGLSVLAIVPGVWQHRSVAPNLGAVVGAGLIFHALYIEYHALVELGGFVMLFAAALRDVCLRRKERLGAADETAH